MPQRPPHLQKLYDTVCEDGPFYRQNLLECADWSGGPPLRVSSIASDVTTQGGRRLVLGIDYTLQGSVLALTAQGFAKFNSLGSEQTDRLVISFTVAAGGQSISNTLTLTVRGANDAPRTADARATLSANGRYIFAVGDFAFIDVDAGDRMRGIKIDSLPAVGRLVLDGRTVRRGDFVSLGDIASGELVYIAPVGGNLLASTSFRFSVLDRRGADSADKTFTIDPRGVANSPPTIAAVTLPVPIAEAANASAQDIAIVTGTLTVNDPNVGDTLTASVVGSPTLALNGGAVPVQYAASVASLMAPGALVLGSAIAANGASQSIAWSYDPGVAALDFLAAGDILTITYAVQVSDGQAASTQKSIVVTIAGTNDAAVIGVPTVTGVVEDAASPTLAVSGSIAISDADRNQAAFLTVATPVGSVLGSLTIAANGNYTYAVGNAAVQYLGAGETRTESFVVTSLDGSTKQVAFTITGTNDEAVISGDIARSLTETNAILSTGGRLFAADVDNAADTFQPQANALGTGGYGLFQVAADGTWSYATDSAHDEFAAGQTYTDTLTVTSQDGTAQVIIVTITGTNDAPVLAHQTAAQTAAIGAAFNLQLAADIFNDTDANDVLSYAATLGDGSALPSWLVFDAATRTFFGTPGGSDGGALSVRVTATDTSSAFASETFALTIGGEAPQMPTLVLAASDQTTAGHTESGRVSLVGITSANEQVELLASDGVTVLASTISDVNGAFRFNDVTVASGDNAFGVRATDPASHAFSLGGSLHIVRDEPSTSSENAALQWNRITLQAIANAGVTPTFASRALAMESLAVYNALAAIDGTQGYLFNAASAADAPPAANVAQAAHDVLVHLFPSQKAMLDALLSQMAPVTVDTTLGASVAATVIAMRENDGWNTEITDTGGGGYGQWRPTGPAFFPASDPQWASLLPFVLTSPGQFLPAAPQDPATSDTITTDSYANDIERTRALGAATGSDRTADQTLIARFWADGTGTVTPAGHWNSIAADASAANGHGLSASARTLLLLNLAEADAAIAAWDTKFTYDLWRPDTAIDVIYGDAAWQPLLLTPAFPEYVSGHSTYSGAAATILTALFGENYQFSTGTTSLVTGERTFDSFWAAAQEAGESRIYGGIHYEMSNQTGLVLGADVAKWVLLAFNGAADTVAPRIILTTPEGQVTNGSPDIRGFVTDNLAGVAILKASIDGAPYVEIPFNRNDGSFTLLTNFATDGSADGEHRVSFVAIDAAGNGSLLSSLSFGIATAAPVISLAADSVSPTNATLDAGSHLKGKVTLPEGDALTSLAYRFDGGRWHSIAFGSDGSFDATVDLSAVSVGQQHSLEIRAIDRAGNETAQSISTELPSLPLTIRALSPSAEETEVGVTFRPRIEFSRAIDPATLTASSFYATDSSGNILPATIVPFADNTGAWLLFQGALPGGQAITLHVVGDLIRTADGGITLDADDNGAAGGSFSGTFTTVSTAAVPGTVIRGRVLDPGADLLPMTFDDVGGGADQSLSTFSDNVWKLPLAGVKVFILGRESEVVYTDASGYFELSNVPTGDVKVAVDGRNATNAPSGTFFPEMVMDVQVQPGVVNTIMGGMGSRETRAANADNPAVYLPRIASAIMTPIGAAGETVVHLFDTGGTTLTDAQRDDLTLTVGAGTIVDGSGNMVSDAKVGIATVPPSMVMDMLPPGILQHSFDITIQVTDGSGLPIDGGAVFTAPATLTMPNVFGLAPGEKTFIMSFDHTTGRLVVDGTATVSADGLTVTTDPGSGVIQPGWHAMTPRLSHAKAIANLKKGDADADVLGEISKANTNIQYVGETVNRYNGGSVATALQLRFGALVPVLGTAGSLTSLGFDTASMAQNAQTFDRTHSLVDGAAMAVDMLKVTLDTAQVGIGTAEIGAAASVVGVPEAVVGEGVKDVLAIGSLGISATESLGQGLGSLAAWFDNWGNRNIEPQGPPIDPDLTIRLSVDGGPHTVRVYVNGVARGDFAVSAQHATGQSDIVTVAIDGLGPHKITVEVLDAVTFTTLASQSNLYIDGAAFNGVSHDYEARLYGTSSDQSVDFHVGTGVTSVLTAFESSLQIAIAENEYVARLLPTLQAVHLALDALFPTIDFIAPDLGLTLAQFEALAPLITDYANATLLLAGHDSPTVLAQKVVDAAALYVGEIKAPLFEPITIGGSGLNPNSGTVAAGSVFYAALDDLKGNVQRFTFDPLVGIDYFLAPNTTFRLTVFDPTGFRTGEVMFTSSGAGGDTAIPAVGIAPDHGALLADGLTATAAFVVGVDPTKRDNLIAGMSDIEALRSGVVDAPLTANTTGVVASLPLVGEARAIEVVAGGANAATLTAYLATGSQGLAVVDVTNPRNPTVRAQFDLGGDAVDVGVDRNLRLAAVALGAAGVAIVDVADPIAPVLVRTLDVAATRIEVIDGMVYAGGGRQIYGYDLATGDLARQLSIPSLVNVQAMAHDGTRLYAVTAGDISGARVLRVFETSGNALSELGKLTLGAGDYIDGDRIFVAEGIAYLGAANGSAAGSYSTVNVSDPSAMSIIGHPPPAGPNQLLPVAGTALALDGSGRALAVQTVNDSANGSFFTTNAADVLTTTNPAVTDALVSRSVLPAVPFDVAVAQGLGFVADGLGGLQILNYGGLDLDGLAPTIAISRGLVDADTLTAGLQFVEGSRLDLDVSALDDKRVGRVELLINGTVVDADVSYPFDLSALLPTIAQNGGSTALTLQVRATDTGGNVGLSEPVAVTLVADSSPFALVSTSPADDTSVSPRQHTVSLTFSHALDYRSVTTDNFRVVAPEGTVLTPLQILLLGDGRTVQLEFGTLAFGNGYTIEVEAAGVRDLSGNTLGAADIVTQFDVRADAMWVSPVSGAWGNPANWNIGMVPTAADSVLMDLAADVVATVSGISTAINFASLEVKGLGSLVLQSFNVGFGPAQTQFNSAGSVTNFGTIDVQIADFEIGGDLHNSGTILINASGNATDAMRLTSDNARIDGGGTIILSNGLPPFGQSGQLATGNNRLAGKTYDYDTVVPVLENVDNLITGSGHIGAGFVGLEGFADLFKGDIFINGADGVIRATGSQNLEINSAKLINRGLIEATAGDPQYGAFIDIGTHGVIASVGTFGQFLRLGLELDNTEGRIVSNGAGTGINLVGTIVRGGTFETRDGGNIFFEKWGLSAATQSQGVSNAPMIDGTANAVRIVGADDSQIGLAFALDETHLQGTLYNHANFTILGFHSTVDARFSRTGSLALTGDATLTGGGNINLQRPGDALANNLDVGITSLQNDFDPDNPPPAHVLTNVDNIIQGSGTIGYAPNLHTSFGPSADRMGLVNETQGQIVANGSAADTLTIRQVDIVNRGTISAVNGSLLEIIDSTVDNALWTGQIVANGGSRVEISGTALSTGYVRTVSDGASVTVAGSSGNGTAFLVGGTNASFTFAGSNDIGGGVWQVEQGNTGLVSAGATLSFSGTIVAAQSTVTIADTSKVLLSDNANFSGGGNFGDSVIRLAGVDALVGSTDTVQQGSFNVTLTVDNVTVSGTGTLGDGHIDLVNNSGGVIQAGAGDVLDIAASTLSSSGVIRADGGTIHVSHDVTVSGGAIDVRNGGVVNVAGSMLTPSGTIEIADGTILVGGHVENGGSILIGSTGRMTVDGDLVASPGTAGAIYLRGGSLEVDGLFDRHTVFMNIGDGSLRLAVSTFFNGTLSGFGSGDRIDLADIDFASAIVEYAGGDADGTLTVTDSFGAVATMMLSYGSGMGLASDPNHFFLADDGNGGVMLTTDLVIDSGGGGSGGSTITNAETITVGPGQTFTDIILDENTQLVGGGSVLLDGGRIIASAAIHAGQTTVTFENVDNTIYGTGTIGDDFVDFFNGAGLVVASTGGSILIDAASTRNVGLIQANLGGEIIVTNDIDNWFGQGSVSAVAGGTIRINGLLHGNGTNYIGNDATGGTLQVGYWQDGAIVFNGSNNTLILDHAAATPVNQGALVVDFDEHQSLELRDIDFSTATLAYSGDSHMGTLTVADDAAHGSDVASLNLLFNFAAGWAGSNASAHFTMQDDGHGGTLVTNDIGRPAALI